VEDKAKTAARFDPLRDKYRVLERFEVQVPDAQLELLDRLDAEWARFQVCAMCLLLSGMVECWTACLVELLG
jgi:hypothetical protein